MQQLGNGGNWGPGIGDMFSGRKFLTVSLKKIRSIPFQSVIIVSTRNHWGIFAECLVLVKVAY